MLYDLSNRLLIGALLAVISGCATTPSPVIKPALPPVPSHIKICFAHTVELPSAHQWNSAKVAEVIARLRQSELSKTRCGKQLIAFYEDLRKGLASEG